MVRASRSIVDPVETYVAPVTLVKCVTNAIAGLADGVLAKVGAFNRLLRNLVGGRAHEWRRVTPAGA